VTSLGWPAARKMMSPARKQLQECPP